VFREATLKVFKECVLNIKDTQRLAWFFSFLSLQHEFSFVTNNASENQVAKCILLTAFPKPISPFLHPQDPPD
jgi:hypothetical protein